MVKLSQQQVQRPTRTERVDAQQSVVQDKQEYDKLKEEASEVSKKLSAVSSIEEYEQEYNKLSPKLKTFFASPKELKQQQTVRIEENKVKTQERIGFVDNKLNELKNRYRQRIESANAISDSDKREKKKESVEKDYETNKQYYEGYKQGLNEGLNELNENKDLSYHSIENYADQIGASRERREDVKIKIRELKQTFAGQIKKVETAQSLQEYQREYAKLPTLIKRTYTPPASKTAKGYFEIKEQPSETKLTPIKTEIPLMDQLRGESRKPYDVVQAIENSYIGKPIGIVSTPKEPTGLEGLYFKAGKKVSQLETTQMRTGTSIGGGKLVALGIAETFLGAGIFVKKLATSPIKTTKETIKGFPEAMAEVGRVAQSEPDRFAGRVIGEILLTKGVGVATTKIIPKVKGFTAKFEPTYRPVVTEPKGIKIIKGIPEIDEIALIPEGKGLKLKGTSAFEKGAYGFSKAEQQAYIGKTGTVVTSAKDLLPIFNKDILITGEASELGLFATPFDIKTGTAQTRASRLGASQELASIFDIVSGEFTVKSPKPQIVTFLKQTIGEKGGFQPYGRTTSGIPTSELEVVLPPESIIRKKRGLGVTEIEGTRIPIYEAEVGKASASEVALIKKILKGEELSAPQIRQIESATGFSETSLKQTTSPKLSMASLVAFSLPKSPSKKTSAVSTEKSLMSDIKSLISKISASTSKAVKSPSKSPTSTSSINQVMSKINKQILASSKIPSINYPRIPRMPPPYVTPFPIDNFSKKKKKDKKLSKSIRDLLYIPDFTARALGLEAETISEKVAKKRLKQLLTGFEVRRPVKVRF